jgi:diacylglycerol kinase (ATP)
MRIRLFLNQSAGEGVSAESLTRLIAEAGHHVEQVIGDAAQLKNNLGAVDCVVAAGGDGTVARAGRVLAGGEMPLAILPMGTANNIASGLAIEGTPEELIARWANHRIVRIDVGALRDGAGEHLFLESVGTGLFEAGIAEGSATLSKEDRDTHLDEARRMYADAVAELRPHRIDLTIDGEELGGEYLLIEVLNTPSIGPGLRLSSNVSAADGLLSVVAARPQDRDRLAHYLRARIAGKPPDAGLLSWPGTRVELLSAAPYHVDDRLSAVTGRLVIEIRPAHLPVLA